ncbi:SWIM zinc finger family protein [Larkinella sp. VNQ87]|uniref:SWIM zinc finger family protein n=1 Tax=Larkinella sp. VNQ87 TaxID=3400921 RepID=UPI003C0543D5
MFTKNTLRVLAGDTVFARGESYYRQGLVKKLKQRGSTFEATVHGSEPTLTPGEELNLYLQALENRCRAEGSVSDYQQLRTFWTDDQRNRFVDSLKSKGGIIHNHLFYAQVLQVENRPTELLKLVENTDWLYVQGLDEILKLAARTYPNECMDRVMERSTQYLDSGQRGRTLYVAIAGWLTALNGFQSLRPQVAIFAGHLYSTYSRLKALREELRNGRLAGK